MRDGLENIFMIPVAIAKVSSPINGEIRVVEQFGKRRMEIGGLTQSGGMVEEIWKKNVKCQMSASPAGRSNVKNVLILGLGAGTAAKVISRKWPRAKIVGVEIDKKVVEIGKRYFNLDKIDNLEIVIDDAAKWVNDRTNKINQTEMRVFDMILIDTYLGDKVPKGMETEKFLINLKQLLTSDGLALFNRLYYGKHRESVNLFLDKLKKIFKDIKVSTFPNFLLPSNLLIYCQ